MVNIKKNQYFEKILHLHIIYFTLEINVKTNWAIFYSAYVFRDANLLPLITAYYSP